MSSLEFLKRNLKYWNDDVNPVTEADERGVLMGLHDFMLISERGRVTSDYRVLAKRFRLNAKLVDRVLGQLIEKGLIRKHGTTLGSDHMDELMGSDKVKKAIERTGKKAPKSTDQLPINSELIADQSPINRQSIGDSYEENATKSTTPSLSMREVREVREVRKIPPTPLQGDASIQPEFELKGEPAKPNRSLQALEAFNAWNAVALRCGLPQCSMLTKGRQRSIMARLKEFGLDGWHKALANVEKSSFLTGEADKVFRADLDFVCQAKSFGKLHDGGYGNGRHTATDKANDLDVAFDRWCGMFASSGAWSDHPAAGPPPNQPGCKVPPAILAKHGLQEARQ